MDDDTYTVTVDVRYQDVDALGHVNNAIYATYLEEARVEYLPAVLGDTGGIEAVLANLEIDYHRPVTMTDEEVEVRIEATAVGTKSITFGYEIYASGDLAAEASTVQVAYDQDSFESVALPEAWRTRISEFDGLD